MDCMIDGCSLQQQSLYFQQGSKTLESFRLERTFRITSPTINSALPSEVSAACRVSRAQLLVSKTLHMCHHIHICGSCELHEWDVQQRET